MERVARPKDQAMPLNIADLKTCLASSIQNAVNKTHPDLSTGEKKRLVEGLQSKVNGFLDAEAGKFSARPVPHAGNTCYGVVPDRRALEPRMSTRCGYVKFESGEKYHSNRIELHASCDGTDGRWSFLLPVDAKPKGRPERDGKCSLHLKDGRVGGCRCTGYDERYLRFEGVERLEKAKAVVIGGRA